MQNNGDPKLQEGAMFALKNLCDKNDLNTPQRLRRLKDMGIIRELETYLSKKVPSPPSLRETSRSSEE